MGTTINGNLGGYVLVYPSRKRRIAQSTSTSTPMNGPLIFCLAIVIDCSLLRREEAKGVAGNEFALLQPQESTWDNNWA